MTKENISKADELEVRIDEILSNRDKEIADLKEKAEQDNKKASEISAALEDATARNDFDAYKAAKSAETINNDAINMHSRRMSQLTAEPLLSEGEFTAEKNIVLDEAAQKAAEAEAKAADLILKLDAIANDLETFTNRANSVLKRLYLEVYRASDLRESQRDKIYYVNSHTPKADRSTLLWFMDTVRTTDMYKRISGRKA